MGKYYIKFGLSKNFNAGSKAMKDIMLLLEKRGYKSVPALPSGFNKILKLVDIPILLFTLLFKVGRKGIVVYFMPSNPLRIRFMKFFKERLGFRLICFINDIESMRMNKSEKYAMDEMKSIAAADVLMVPNDNSVRILQNEHQIVNFMIPVGVWDYLVDDSIYTTECFQKALCDIKTVAYAGNLALASFIVTLYTIDLNFRIWGSGEVEKNEDNVTFMGEEYPDKLVSMVADCSWGMVWYGPSTDSCNGQLSSYLRFCNSHKCGLYLAAGIPVIVWQESGMASFVHKNQIGICVSSLKEAADIINHMDVSTYSHYRNNAQRIGRQVRRGHFFLRALNEAEKLED